MVGYRARESSRCAAVSNRPWYPVEFVLVEGDREDFTRLREALENHGAPSRRAKGMPRIAPEELGRLYREHAPALRLYVRQWLEGDEDPVQDAFVRLAQQSPAPEQVLPWLYCVVRNGALAAGRGAAPEAPPPAAGERLGGLVCRSR